MSRDDDDLSSVLGDRKISSKHILAGMSPVTPRGPSLHSPSNSVGGNSQPTTSAGLGRSPLGANWNTSEKFKKDENSFLSRDKSAPKRPPISTYQDKEELQRFLEANGVTGLGGLDEKQSAPSSSSLHSPNSPLSPTHRARRPSYMQATQQELKRQAELKEAQSAREAKKADEIARSTRRAHGKTNTDLYIAQQADLEAKRLALVEKEEAERKAERARVLAKIEAAAAAAAENNANNAAAGGSATSRTRPALVHASSTSNSTSSGSQSARGGGGGPTLSSSASTSFTQSSNSHHAHTNSSSQGSPATESLTPSLSLQQELEKREGMILRDVATANHFRGVSLSTPLGGHRGVGGGGGGSTADSHHHHPAFGGMDEHSEGSEDEDDEDSDEDEDSADDETRANTLANTGRTPRFHLVTTIKEHHRQGSDGANEELPPPVARVKRNQPQSVAQIYDPATARIVTRHDGASADTTGLDLLMASAKFKKGRREKKKQMVQASIHSGFGRMTEAQIERQVDQMIEKKSKEISNNNATSSKPAFSHSKSHTSQASSSSSAMDDSSSASPKNNNTNTKRSFFPSLWKRITGAN